MLQVIILIVSELTASPAYAVIFGERTPAEQVSTGRIEVEQWRWYPGTNSMTVERDDCSAVVVGTQPLTVLTVAHCLRDIKIDPETQIPHLSFYLNQPLPALRYAIYNRFEDVAQNIANDLAVLVFDGDAPEGVTALPILQSVHADNVQICGFGLGFTETDSEQPSCAQKAVLSPDADFYNFVPQIYEQLDPILHLQFRAQFMSKSGRISSVSSLLAVNRVEDDRYQFDLPMPTRGDSGGPWIARKQNGERGVVALTSFIETFYRKNKQWPFFNEHRAPLTDYAYAAYGVRLDTAEAYDLFRRARLVGADIRVHH